MVFILIVAEEALTCSEVAHGVVKERVAWLTGANTLIQDSVACESFLGDVQLY